MVDARGLSCPIPVVMVQKEVKNHAPEQFTVLVDNRVAVENITRFANNQGYTVAVAEKEDEFALELKKK